MRHIQLHPVDTWFFRDATPFTAQVSPQEGVGSVFPPHPPTIVGALRAAIARHNGWDRSGRWDTALDPVLGTGPEDLGNLSFGGPFVLRNGQPLFPCPRHLMGATDENGKWVPRAFLRPGSPVVCDLGEVRLPQLARSFGEGVRLKPGKAVWITARGLSQVLRGELPATDHLVATESLWAEEDRIGLQRDRDTRTASRGMLYSTRHVRLQRGVSLGVQVAGVPDTWTFPSGMVPLGGESRLAECADWPGAASVDQPTGQARERFALVAVTPLDLDLGVVRGRRAVGDVEGARVISACLSRPVRIGGWDSLARQPLPPRSFVATGSVLFCEAPGATRFKTTARGALGLFQVGSKTQWGFGLAAIGAWPSDKETTER